MSEMRERLLDVAAEMVQRGGVSGLTLRDLGKRVGIKSSSVAYHFGNKASLLLELVEGATAQLRDAQLALAARPSAKQRLDGIVDVFVATLEDDRHCLCGMLTAEKGELDEATDAALRGYFRVLEGWVAEQLGELDSASASAPLLVSALEGALLIDRLDGRPERLDAVRALIANL